MSGMKNGRATYVDMPHHVGNVISASTVSKLSDIATDKVVPTLLLKIANTTRE